MKRSFIFSIVCGIVVFGTLIANVMSSLIAPFYMGPFILSGGFFTFPLLYVASDIISKAYGYTASRKTSLLGLGANVLMVIVFEIGYFLLPGGKSTLSLLHTTAAIVTFAGLLAGQVGDWCNDIVFQKLKSRGFYVQAIGSSVVGQVVDSFIFVFLGLGMAFNLPLKIMLINAGSQVLFKLLIESVLFPATNKLARYALKKDPYCNTPVVGRPERFNFFG
jgi:uncharacterized integral membrane protein (TIGR00697 family)